jgi:histone H3/H4
MVVDKGLENADSKVGKVSKVSRKKKNSKGGGDGVIDAEFVKKVAGKAGVKRVSGLVKEATGELLKGFMKNAISDSATRAEHAGRKIVNTSDVTHAVKRKGRS